MHYKKKMVCLANSIKKHPSRCVAGKELVGTNTTGWIRPVTSDVQTEGAIPFGMTRYADGSFLRTLDIVEIPLQGGVPKKCQTENHLVADGAWVKHGRATWEDLAGMVDQAADLWGTGRHTKNGKNDQIPSAQAATLGDSLRLIRPEDFHLKVREVPVFQSDKTKKDMRGIFTHGGIEYVLKITDPVFTDKQNQLVVDQLYSVPNAYIVVSVSDELNGNHYKLVAGIIRP